MKIKYWLKSAIKDIFLFTSKKRYANYCDAVNEESDRLPPGIGIGYGSYWQFLEDESWMLRRIYNW